MVTWRLGAWAIRIHSAQLNVNGGLLTNHALGSEVRDALRASHPQGGQEIKHSMGIYCIYCM